MNSYVKKASNKEWHSPNRPKEKRLVAKRARQILKKIIRSL